VTFSNCIKAPDIPGIPPGLKSDTPNYLATLKALRNELPDKYSISIAAPASYWYLKAFPISEIAKVVDYIVYMAYDLHGALPFLFNVSAVALTNPFLMTRSVGLRQLVLAIRVLWR
jgi:GH18 family chitinase